MIADVLGCNSTQVTVEYGPNGVSIKTPMVLTAEQQSKILRYTDPEAWRNQVIEDLLTRLEKASSIEDVKLAATAVKDAAGLTAVAVEESVAK
jgi:hypothetical protein